jgi:hypothetical protein
MSVERAFLSWEMKWSPARWLPWRHVFWGREGFYVIVRGALLAATLGLVAATTWTTTGGVILRVAALGLVSLMMLDILVVHASIAFVSRRPASPLRSAVLALVSFFQIPLGFAVVYRAIPECFNVSLTWDRAIYFSVITATTVGYGDIAPRAEARLAHAAVVAELVTSVTFLSVLVARLISLTTASGQQGPGGLKAMEARAVEQADAADEVRGGS